MPPTKPVALCTHLLPSGKLCRGIALRNERHCRAHIRTHRLLDRVRVQEEAIDRLVVKVQHMDLRHLLDSLHGKLEDLNRAHNLARFPEIRYLLIVAIDRLYEATHFESNIDLQLELNQFAFDPDHFDPNKIKQMLAPNLKSNG